MPIPDDMLETACDADTGEPEPATEFDADPKVGRYVLLDRLGTGGMGTVFLAHDPELDRKVAIKLLRGGSSRSAQVRMLREAQAMARVSHANVAAVFDVGWFGSEVFLAMEYLAGGTIKDWLAARERSWREVLDLFIAAGDGLAAAHAVGLVHRDFKPANVLLSLAEVPKVTDFGLVRNAGNETGTGTQTHTKAGESSASGLSSAAVVDSRGGGGLGERASASSSSSSSSVSASISGSGSRSALDIQLTAAGNAVGTPAYMAPEQFRAGEVDARSDQFSFCVALHEALWGVGPFAGDDVEARLTNVIHDRRVPRPQGRDVPEWLIPIIDRGLAADCDARWPSMVELLAALRDDPRTRRRARRRWLIAGGLALGLGGAVWAESSLGDARCDEASGAAARLWSAHAPAVLAAVEASAPSYAAANVERIEAGVDDWVERWTDARAALCRERADASEAARLGERCLSEQLDALSSLLMVLDERGGAPGVAGHAITAIGGLPDPAACAEPSYAASYSQGCTPSLGLALHRVRALELAGLDGEGLDAAEALLSEPGLDVCPALEDQALVLAARLELAHAAAPRELAADRAAQALRQANRREDVRLARAAALTLARAARREHQSDAALVWIETASLFGDRLGSRPSEVIETQLARVEVHHDEGAYARAAEVLRSVEPLLLDNLGRAHPTYFRYLREAAELELARNERDRARALYQQAEVLALQLYGPDHPTYVALLGPLAQLAPSPAEKLAQAEAALAKTEAIHGRDSAEAALAIDRLATVELIIGQDERGRDTYAELIARLDALPGVGVRDRARALTHYGVALRRTRDLAGAERALRRALELVEAELGDQHPELSSPLINLANVVEERGRVAEAVGLQRRALALDERRGETLSVALLLNNMGRLELELGQASQAHRDLERAAKIGRALLPAGDLRNIDYLTDLALAKVASQGPAAADPLFEDILARCDAHPEPDNKECLYSRGIVARHLLDHRPEQAARALALSARSIGAGRTEQSATDGWILRFIHLRALAATGDLAAARAGRASLLAELEDAPAHRLTAELRETIRAWTPL